SYREAVKLLTLAIEEERGEAIKVGLAYRFRGLAYKHLGRRDEALNDFLEVIRIQPKLDLGYYDAGVIYNLTNRYKEAVDAMTRAIDLRQDDRGLGRRRGERECLFSSGSIETSARRLRRRSATRSARRRRAE